MKVLLVGSGGREHALAWQLAQSDHCEELYVAPGNAGVEECAVRVAIKDSDIDGLVDFAKDKDIDLVVIGPEAPLVAGLADRLAVEGIKAFGPSADAAQLEGSKAFMKALCDKYNIPTAAYGHFSDLDKALAFIHEHGAPIVIKADGLAAGKGVIIASTIEEAIEAATNMLSGSSFGDAGQSIIIEEFMDGEELSFFALCDGTTVLPLTSAQDHKRVGDGDVGLNTGGMGAYSPAHMMNDALHDEIMNNIIIPTAKGMAQDGHPFKGVLYAGIMLVDGKAKLLEYNARFGDPECQPVMMRLRSDLLEILDAVAEERLSEWDGEIQWTEKTALCVVMAANGYPQNYAKGTEIKNTTEANNQPDVKVFHAGTDKDGQGNLVNTGGRVLGITACCADIATAQQAAYDAIKHIDWPQGFCRSDIGWRAIESCNLNKKAVSG